MKKIIIIFISIIVISSASASSTDAIVKGFAKYQAGRVENIVLNEMIYEIKENRYFKQIFPLTNEALKNYNTTSGKRLIPLIQHFIELDMQNFENATHCMVFTYVKNVIGNGDVNKSFKYNYIITKEDFLRKLRNSFHDTEFTITKLLNSQKAKEDSEDDKVLCENKFIDKKIKDIENIKTILLNIKDKDQDFKKKKEEYWNNILRYIENTQAEKKSIYLQMHYLIYSFDKIGISDERGIYQEFSKLALFLAELSNAANDDNDNDKAATIEALINSYVQSESNSFNEKRTKAAVIYDERFGGSNWPDGSWSWSLPPWPAEGFNWPPAFGVGSYFGVGLSSSGEDKYRSYGPVGIEVGLLAFSWGDVFEDSRLFLGFAPLDFGIPIQNELTEKEYSASFQDIRSNSVYLSLNPNYKPYAIILSYHPDDSNRTGRDDSTIMLSFAFDLPLYF